MAEEPKKGLFHRIGDKAANKFAERVGDWILDALKGAAKWVASAFFVGWLLLWMANEWACINKTWCEVRGWSLGALIVVTVVMTAAVAYVGVVLLRAQRELREVRATKTELKGGNARVLGPGESPSFQKITVEDQHLKLRWFIRKPPKEWLDWRNIAGTVSPDAVQHVLDGPFHAGPGCNAALVENWIGIGGNKEPVFADRCSICGQMIYKGLPAFGGEVPARAWRVRASAIEELQRMERNGTRFDGAPIVFEQPGPAYWNVMLPPD
jgi:hypothetical protein